MTSKYFDDLLKGEKLDGSHYYIWCQKIQYLLNADDNLSAITKVRDAGWERFPWR